MGRLRTIARRSFLIGSAAIVGGVAFGVYAYKKPHENPLLRDLGAGEAALNPYVLVTASGVTLITPRADLGQGAASIQAALIAEELDIALDQINVSPGRPSPAYFNGTVAAEAFPLAATSDSFMARRGRDAAHVAAKFLGLQITGGSSTVPDAFEKLRIAGAVARETLKAAAARQSGHEASKLKTENGAVILPDGTALSYADLAATAAEMDPVSTVSLRPESEWRYLGRDMLRLDIPAKSTGTQDYGIDFHTDGMLYATTRTNPRIGGGMKQMDAELAKSMPGVKKIVPITGGYGVIADNTWRAFQAADMVDAEWGAAPYPADSEALWKALEQSFDPDLQDSQFKDEGDVDAALSDGEMLEASYRVPYLAHAPLEPMNATALFQEGRLDIWAGTQIPRFVEESAMAITGLDREQIHLHALMQGGSFGRRLEDDFIRQAVELAMAMPGTPIKLTWTREEDMRHDFPRTFAMSKARGTVKDGQVAAYDLQIAAPSTSGSQLSRVGQPAMGPDTTIVAGAWDQPFHIPNYRVTGFRAPELVPISSWRSVGASANGFLHECFLDELILAAGADPLAERLRLCWHDPSRKVLEAVGEMSSWGSDLGANRGRGLAFTLSFGVPVAEVVEVTNTEDGIKIDTVYVAAEVGKILDPINFDNQVKGGVIWGLGHAMNCELTYEDGFAQQENFPDFQGMRFDQCPKIVVQGLTNDDTIRGIGEPSVPPAAPALANAIFAATGQRIRELPLHHHIDFV